MKSIHSPEFMDRFFDKTTPIPPSACLFWIGSVKTERGYGEIQCDGEKRMATQIAWEIANNKKFPKDKMACHSCDEPFCVNAGHIWPGTMKDNIQDCIKKGRKKPLPKNTFQQDKKHCPAGHPYSPENTRFDLSKSGTVGRVCIACAKKRSSKFYIATRKVKKPRVF